MVKVDAFYQGYFYLAFCGRGGIVRFAHIEDTERLAAFRRGRRISLVQASHLLDKAGAAITAALSALLSEDDRGGGREAVRGLRWTAGVSRLEGYVFFVLFFRRAVVGSPHMEQRPGP